MEKLIDLLKEPSTYAGLSGIALAIGINAEEWAAVSTTIAAIFGAIAVFTREGDGE